jgi:hypothetical protein
MRDNLAIKYSDNTWDEEVIKVRITAFLSSMDTDRAIFILFWGII